MFQPATVIQSYLATSCRFGFEAVNIVSTQTEMTNVINVVASVVQRSAFLLSLGMKNKASTPNSGKNVSRVSGCKINSMFHPRCPHPQPFSCRRGLGEGRFYFKIKYPRIRTTPNNTDNA